MADITLAETLRKAAALMRERAEKATPGPWVPRGEGPDCWFVCSVTHGLVSTGVHEDPAVSDLVLTERDQRDAEHMAGMDPIVAVVVAEWLAAEARMTDLRGNSSEGHAFLAVTVARAYLREARNGAS
jgi:hypothetical protein